MLHSSTEKPKQIPLFQLIVKGIDRGIYLDSDCASICLVVASYGHMVQKLTVLWTLLKGTWALRLSQRGMTNLRWRVESKSISLNESLVALMWTGEIK